MNRLFAVYLGGKAKGATLELHDIVFAVGADIKSTFSQLNKSWFGTKESIHIDSYTELSHVEGYKISLSKYPPASPKLKLFFVNVGSYTKGRFGENHDFLFLVDQSLLAAKKRAKDIVSA